MCINNKKYSVGTPGLVDRHQVDYQGALFVLYVELSCIEDKIEL